MWQAPKHLVIETEVLPEIFPRVVYAKQLIERGEVSSISEAVKQAGISRSAMYKYKDSVFPYETGAVGMVVTYHLVLKDRPGVLSSVLSELYRRSANVLTINQNIPVDGVAPVSISILMTSASSSDMDIMVGLRGIDGVLEVRRISTR
jgi:chorismate mutase